MGDVAKASSKKKKKKKWIQDTSQITKVFIKNYTEESHEGYFYEAAVAISPKTTLTS